MQSRAQPGRPGLPEATQRRQPKRRGFSVGLMKQLAKAGQDAFTLMGLDSWLVKKSICQRHNLDLGTAEH